MVQKNSFSRKLFIVCNAIFLLAFSVMTLSPLVHVIMSSFSHPIDYAAYTGLALWPKGFSLEGYQRVFASVEIWRGYRNTIIYVACSVSLGTWLTICGAYVLSRKGLLWNKLFMPMIAFTMIFNGGIVPTFLLINKLGWMDSPLAVIIPTCMSTFNLVIMRTFFSGIPVSLEESAKLDGASNLRILISIMIPLAKASIAVIALFYTVTQWNSYFQAMMYLRNRNLFPLQLVLREILLQNQGSSAMAAGSAGAYNTLLNEIMKYGTIVVSIVPMLCAYPFIQRYFVKGVMIGSVKG